MFHGGENETQRNRLRDKPQSSSEVGEVGRVGSCRREPSPGVGTPHPEPPSLLSPPRTNFRGALATARPAGLRPGAGGGDAPQSRLLTQHVNHPLLVETWIRWLIASLHSTEYA